jgi:hypothetical protein
MTRIRKEIGVLIRVIRVHPWQKSSAAKNLSQQYVSNV